jgi:hypothetical protein
MLDLKYSMQHLLARMLHKTNPKASLKAVDGMIQDVEAYVLSLRQLVPQLLISFQISPYGLGVHLSFPSRDPVTLFFVTPRFCASSPAFEQNLGHG